MKKILSLILILVVTACCLPVALAETDGVVTYGSYPQTKLDETEDAELISALNGLVDSDDFVSYGYYSGSGTAAFDESGNLDCKAGDYMKYADAEYEGSRYRAVVFSSYRPEYSYGSLSASAVNTSGQKGFEAGTVYWFRYEPVEWTVLSRSGSEILAVSSLVLDARSFRSTYTDSTEAQNLYDDSTVKSWLENDFSVTAFGKTNGNIRLMTYTEAASLYYDSTTARLVSSTDYAKINRTKGNITVNGVADCCDWWLMTSAGDTVSKTTNGKYVSYMGSVSSTRDITGVSGIRPVITISASEESGEEEKLPAKADYVIREYFENTDGTYTLAETEKQGFDGGTAEYNPDDYNYDDFYILNEEKSTLSAVLSESNTAELTVYYDRARYNILFDFGCDEYESITKNYRYGAEIEFPEIPGRPGYETEGWGERESVCTVEKTYSLKWERLSFTISFDTDGGTETEPLTALFGDEITAPQDPVKQGYVFAGWSEEIPAVMPAYSLNIKALWVPSDATEYRIETYTENKSGEYEKSSSRVFTGTTGNEISAEIPVPDGYIFNESLSTSTGIIQPDGSSVLSLYFERKSYTLTFDIEGVKTPFVLKKGDRITYPSAPGKQGCTFLGWRPAYIEMPGCDTVISAVYAKNPALVFYGFTSTKSIDYRTTVTYHASFDGENAKLVWIYNGSEYADDGSCSFTVSSPASSYTIGCRVDTGCGSAESGTETVNVRNSLFFDKIIWFFRNLFSKDSLTKDQW